MESDENYFYNEARNIVLDFETNRYTSMTMIKRIESAMKRAAVNTIHDRRLQKQAVKE